MADHKEKEFLEALMRQAISQCIDIERLAYLEETLVDALTTDGSDRDKIATMVQDQIDRTWQELMFEFERLRSAECPSCEVFEHGPFVLPYLGEQ